MAEKNPTDVQQEIIDKDTKTEMLSGDTTKEINTTPDTLNDVINLPHGNALTSEEAYRITAAQRVKFIVLAGAVASGKTTLITTIYHLLMKGPIADYYFAGSETLVGFEQRCYQARVASGKTYAKTERTLRGIPENLLHLKLYNSKQKSFQNILLTDYSGENYSSVIGNVQLAKTEFSNIKRADCLVLLIDGDFLSNKKRRHGAEQEAMQLLVTFCDADIINENINVNVLISKYDIVKDRIKEDVTLKEFIKQTEVKFKNKFSNRIKNFSFSNVIAMPEDTSKFIMGKGLNKLLRSWVEHCVEANYKYDEQMYERMSEFDLFAQRVNY